MSTSNYEPINQDELPRADFTYVPVSGIEPLHVIFTDTSTPDSGDYAITSWLWSFGDGETSSLQNPEHIFLTDGTYTVVLRVANSMGQGSTQEQVVATDDTVPPPAPPAGTTTIYGTVDSGPLGNLEEIYEIRILLAAAEAETPVEVMGYDLSYLIPTYDAGYYTNYGFYNITPGTYYVYWYVSYRDDSGDQEIYYGGAEAIALDGEAILVDAIYVNESSTRIPTPSINADPPEGVAPLTVDFTESSTYEPSPQFDITSWLWDFDDGSPTSTEQNPTHVFQSPGVYTVDVMIGNIIGHRHGTYEIVVTAS